MDEFLHHTVGDEKQVSYKTADSKLVNAMNGMTSVVLVTKTNSSTNSQLCTQKIMVKIFWNHKDLLFADVILCETIISGNAYSMKT